VAIDNSDPTGNTAYVGVMGFTAPPGSGSGPGHVWQTTNAGANWTDFTGTGANALPDDPVNALIVDPTAHIIYAGTDVGVFESSTASPAWAEVGPASGQPGFLPNVAVTALALFNSGGQKLLRASTYGRGVWQFNVANAPDFEIVVSNPLLVAFPGTNATFSGTLTALDGYSSSVTLSCIAGSTSPPSPCAPSPATLTPTSSGTPFSVTVGAGAITNYSFNLQGAGSDPNRTTHLAGLTLEVVNFGLTPPSPNTIVEPRGGTTTPVSFQVTAQGSFDQTVTLSCGFAPAITGAACSFTPAATVTPTQSSPVNMTASVTVPAGTNTGNYTVTLQATSTGAPAPVTETFTMTVVPNPIFVLSEPTPFPNVKEGSPGTSGPITVTSQDGFSGTVSLNCAGTYGSGSCSVSPPTVSTFPSTVNMIINGASFLPGSYQIVLQGTSGSLMQSLPVPFNVGTYTLKGPVGLSAAPGGQAQANLTFASTYSYGGQVSATCTVTSLPGAQCMIAPNPVTVSSGPPASATATIDVPSNAAGGGYSVNINSEDVTGEPTVPLTLPLTIGASNNFQLAITQAFSTTATAGSQQLATVSVTPNYSGSVTATCTSNIPAGQCSASPNPLPIVAGTASALTITLNVSNSAAPNPSNSYSVNLTVADPSGQPTQNLALPITVVQDYSLGNFSPATQSINPGGSATYNFSVLPVGGGYNNSVTLSCSVAPLFVGSCSIAPNVVGALAGGTPTAAVLTVNTDAASAQTWPWHITSSPWLYGVWLLLLGVWAAFWVAAGARRKGLAARAGLTILLIVFLLGVLSCGGGGSNGGSSSGGNTLPGTYTVTVTGSPASISQPSGSTVTLTVQ
jgi:hypothetical protein